MIYRVLHKTAYQYTDPVSLCHNLLHLKPRDSSRQTCLRGGIAVQPEPKSTQNLADYFGNPITLFTIQEPHRRLSIASEHRIEVKPAPAARLRDGVAWEQVRDRLRTDPSPDSLDAFQHLFQSPYVPCMDHFAAYAAPSFPHGQPMLLGVLELTKRIHREFRYDSTATTLSTPVEAVLAQRRGVCQDFAHLMIACLRSLSLPARYVSGYLLTQPPPGQARLVGADASHAWVSVYCPEIGWVDFDPTNNLMPGEQHITVAWGRDYDDVSPVKGVILGGGSHTMSVSVDVAPVT